MVKNINVEKSLPFWNKLPIGHDVIFSLYMGGFDLIIFC